MRKLRSFIIIAAIMFLSLITVSQALLPSINYWQTDSITGWKHTPNFSGAFNGPGFKAKVRFNDEGFRDVDRKLERDDGALRIAMLGDSFVEALQIDQENVLTSVLEGKLNSVIKSEVMNFGVSSFGTANEYLTYEAYVKKYHPDLVIIVFCINDFVDNDELLSSHRPCIDLMKHGPYFSFTANGDIAVKKFTPYNKGIFKSVFSKVKILSFLRNIYYRWKVTHADMRSFHTDEIGLYSDKYTNEIKNCVSLTEAVLKKFLLTIISDGSIPIVCLSYPSYVVDPYHRDLLMQRGFDLSKIDVNKPFDIIKKLCDSLNVDVVDIREMQLQIYKFTSQGLFLKEGHWNENGHKIMAGAIEREIIPKINGYKLK